MNSKVIFLIMNGIVLTILQLLISDKMTFYGLLNPKIYPVFLLLLPRTLKPSVYMTLGFLYGGLLDILLNTYGFGIASSVFITFARPYLLGFMYNKSPLEESEIHASVQGEKFVFLYLLFGLLIFHIFYFFIELGEIANVFFIILKSILSTIIAIVVYTIYYMMFNSLPKKK